MEKQHKFLKVHLVTNKVKPIISQRQINEHSKQKHIKRIFFKFI